MLSTRNIASLQFSHKTTQNLIGFRESFGMWLFRQASVRSRANF
jgi:hypothetical protein